MEAAGIAPAGPDPQVIMREASCVDDHRSCLHTTCADLPLRELVASWHRLTPDVSAETGVSLFASRK
jgi:hypothetical protein